MFLDNYGVELDDDSLQFPENQNGGKEYVEGETKCPDGKDGELSVVVWDSPTDTSNGRRYVSGFDDIRIDQDGMVFTIAFVPAGTDDPDAAVGRRAGRSSAPPTRARPAADHHRRRRGSTPGSHRGHRRRDTGTADSSPTSSPALDADDCRRHDHHGRLMRAVVLVGGFGTRLRPLTDTHPQADAADRPRPADRAA